MKIFITCKEGFEKVLVRESVFFGLSPLEEGKGWCSFERRKDVPFQMSGGICFAFEVLTDALPRSAPSANVFTDLLLDGFLSRLGDKRLEGKWPCFFFSAGPDELVHHAQTIRTRWVEKLRRKMSRVAQLAEDKIPTGENTREGFFVCLTGFHQAYVSFRAFSQGQQRMKMDPLAPSRSYLKIEEAFHLFGRAPGPNETVIDLGAAPGGWSFGALKRGAWVTAVDNGPLREPIRSHPAMTHLLQDALKYHPQAGKPVDWLFCDVLETPEVIQKMLSRWVENGWCRNFVVNLKLGRRDPVAVLDEIRASRREWPAYCRDLVIRHLYHDRDEITLIGTLSPRS